MTKFQGKPRWQISVRNRAKQHQKFQLEYEKPEDHDLRKDFIVFKADKRRFPLGTDLPIAPGEEISLLICAEAGSKAGFLYIPVHIGISLGNKVDHYTIGVALYVCCPDRFRPFEEILPTSDEAASPSEVLSTFGALLDCSIYKGLDAATAPQDLLLVVLRLVQALETSPSEILPEASTGWEDMFCTALCCLFLLRNDASATSESLLETITSKLDGRGKTHLGSCLDEISEIRDSWEDEGQSRLCIVLQLLAWPHLKFGGPGSTKIRKTCLDAALLSLSCGPVEEVVAAFFGVVGSNFDGKEEQKKSNDAWRIQSAITTFFRTTASTEMTEASVKSLLASLFPGIAGSETSTSNVVGDLVSLMAWEDSANLLQAVRDVTSETEDAAMDLVLCQRLTTASGAMLPPLDCIRELGEVIRNSSRSLAGQFFADVHEVATTARCGVSEANRLRIGVSGLAMVDLVASQNPKAGTMLQASLCGVMHLLNHAHSTRKVDWIQTGLDMIKPFVDPVGKFRSAEAFVHKLKESHARRSKNVKHVISAIEVGLSLSAFGTSAAAVLNLWRRSLANPGKVSGAEICQACVDLLACEPFVPDQGRRPVEAPALGTGSALVRSLVDTGRSAAIGAARAGGGMAAVFSFNMPARPGPGSLFGKASKPDSESHKGRQALLSSFRKALERSQNRRPNVETLKDALRKHAHSKSAKIRELEKEVTRFIDSSMQKQVIAACLRLAFIVDTLYPKEQKETPTKLLLFQVFNLVRAGHQRSGPDHWDWNMVTDSCEVDEFGALVQVASLNSFLLDEMSQRSKRASILFKNLLKCMQPLVTSSLPVNPSSKPAWALGVFGMAGLLIGPSDISDLRLDETEKKSRKRTLENYNFALSCMQGPHWEAGSFLATETAVNEIAHLLFLRIARQSLNDETTWDSLSKELVAKSPNLLILEATTLAQSMQESAERTVKALFGQVRAVLRGGTAKILDCALSLFEPHVFVTHDVVYSLLEAMHGIRALEHAYLSPAELYRIGEKCGLALQRGTHSSAGDLFDLADKLCKEYARFVVHRDANAQSQALHALKLAVAARNAAMYHERDPESLEFRLSVVRLCSHVCHFQSLATRATSEEIDKPLELVQRDQRHGGSKEENQVPLRDEKSEQPEDMDRQGWLGWKQGQEEGLCGAWEPAVEWPVQALIVSSDSSQRTLVLEVGLDILLMNWQSIKAEYGEEDADSDRLQELTRTVVVHAISTLRGKRDKKVDTITSLECPSCKLVELENFPEPEACPEDDKADEAEGTEVGDDEEGDDEEEEISPAETRCYMLKATITLAITDFAEAMAMEDRLVELSSQIPVDSETSELNVGNYVIMALMQKLPITERVQSIHARAKRVGVETQALLKVEKERVVDIGELGIFEHRTTLKAHTMELLQTIHSLCTHAKEVLECFQEAGDFLRSVRVDKRLAFAKRLGIDELLCFALDLTQAFVALRLRLGCEPNERSEEDRRPVVIAGLLTDQIDACLRDLGLLLGSLQIDADSKMKNLYRLAGFRKSGSVRRNASRVEEFDIPQVQTTWRSNADVVHDQNLEDYVRSDKVFVKKILSSDNVDDLMDCLDMMSFAGARQANQDAPVQVEEIAEEDHNEEAGMRWKNSIELDFGSGVTTMPPSQGTGPKAPGAAAGPSDTLSIREQVTSKVRLAQHSEEDTGSHREGRKLTVKYDLNMSRQMKAMMQHNITKEYRKLLKYQDVGKGGQWRDVIRGKQIQKLDPNKVTYGLLSKFMREYRDIFVSKIRQGYSRIQRSEVKHEFEFCFLVDHSGSMDGRKIQHALEALVLLMEALKRLECRFAVARFGDQTTQQALKTMREALDLEVGQRIVELCLEPDEGTYPAEAVKWANDNQGLGWSPVDKKNVHKFIVMITDGLTAQTKPEDYRVRDKNLVIIQIGDVDAGTVQDAQADLERVAGKDNTRLVRDDRLEDLHVILSELILKQFVKVFQSLPASAPGFDYKTNLAPLVCASTGLVEQYFEHNRAALDMKALEDQDIQTCGCSPPRNKVPWADKLDYSRAKSVDVEQAVKVRVELREVYRRLQDKMLNVSHILGHWRQCEMKLSTAISSMHAVLSECVLPINRYTRSKPGFSGNTIDFQGVIKYITSQGEYKKIYKNKKAGGVREYRIALFLDVSASMQGPVGDAAADGLITMICALEQIGITNFIVGTFGDATRLIKSEDQPWDATAKHILLSSIHQRKMMDTSSLDSDAVHHAVSLLGSSTAPGSKLCFVFSDGYGSRGINLSRSLLDANEMDVKVVGVAMGLEDTGVHLSYQNWVTAIDAKALGEGLQSLFSESWAYVRTSAGQNKALQYVLAEDHPFESLRGVLGNTWTQHQNYFDEVKQQLAQDRVLHLNTEVRSSGAGGRASVDVCFVMDCTGSMGSWITACQERVMDIAAQVQAMMEKQGKTATVRMAFVAYRDYTGKGTSYDNPGIDICPFTDDIEQLRGVVQRQRASGGGDGPEDICGGLREAQKLSWQARAKHLFLIADAPCHGQKYHTMADNYPGGDPTGLVPEEQLVQIMGDSTGTKGINVTFVKINTGTDQMVNVFNAHCQAKIPGPPPKQIKVVDLSKSTGAASISENFGRAVEEEIISDWMAHHF
eukprot:1190052-Rhodomonas_salina.1